MRAVRLDAAAHTPKKAKLEVPPTEGFGVRCSQHRFEGVRKAWVQQ